MNAGRRNAVCNSGLCEHGKDSLTVSADGDELAIPWSVE